MFLMGKIVYNVKAPLHCQMKPASALKVRIEKTNITVYNAGSNSTIRSLQINALNVLQTPPAKGTILFVISHITS